MIEDIGPASGSTTAEFIETVFDRCRMGQQTLTAALSALEDRLDKSDWRAMRADEITLCCAIGRVALAASDHHVARRVLGRGRARLQPNTARGLALRVRVLEMELHAVTGHESRGANELAEVLRDLSDPECHLAQMQAFIALMKLLVASDSLKSAAALNEWMAARATETGGLLARARIYYLMFATGVAHRRCELAHPYEQDSLVRQGDDDNPLPYAEALQQLERSSAALAQSAHLIATHPPEILPLSLTLEGMVDTVVKASSVLRGDPQGEMLYLERFETALAQGNLVLAAEAANSLAFNLVDSGRASHASALFNRIKQTRQPLSPAAARLVEYGLYKTAEATGHASAALAAYRRYVEAVRSLIANPMRSAAYVVSIAQAPSVHVSPVTSVPRHVRRAIEIMEQRYGDSDFQLEELAQMVGVSDRTLRAAFSLHLGESPSTHLRNLRLESARQRLAQEALAGRPRVQALARECGFDHPGRFAKAFAERYGCSPSEYAKR